MYEWKINDEQRVILNLSELASAVIVQDMLEFRSKSKSAFVCRVFDHYYQRAEATISKTLSRLEEDLCSTLNCIPDELRKNVMDIMITQRKNKLIKKHTEYKKGSGSVALRLHNKTLETIHKCMGTEAEYYRSIGAYVRAIVEEYCCLPYIEREKIYFKDRFDKIEAANQCQKQLLVSIQDGRCFVVYPLPGDTKEVDPDKAIACVRTDRLKTANYLVGYSRLPTQKKREKIAASFRISSLTDLEICDELAILGEDDVKSLKKKIKDRGAEFLMRQETEIRVRLTQNGIYRLFRMSHLRPHCCRQEGDIFTFMCTQLQAEYYFLGMGPDCEILEPESLRNRFAEIYYQANNIYT